MKNAQRKKKEKKKQKNNNYRKTYLEIKKEKYLEQKK